MYFSCLESMYYVCAESMYYVCGGSTELDGNLAPNDTCDAYRIVDVENRLEYFQLLLVNNSLLACWITKKCST